MTMIGWLALGLAQAAAPVEAPPVPPPVVDAAAICAAPPLDAELTIAVAEPLGSRETRTGQMFRIVLDEALVVDGRTMLPAGLTGAGEVIHASRPKFMNANPGELILAARYLELGSMRLPLRAFRLVATGRLYRNGLLGPQTGSGTNVQVPAGSTATAKVAGACVAGAVAN